ncbi:hypothetical protein Pfo_024931 [Paulownia fortunei]|nr:hypothetical protein Pfo_024931 [Paulownia fortunei]
MERRMKAGAGSILAVLVVLVFANGVQAQNTYACWGGCYNKCFTRTGRTKPERLACEYQCLNSCVPHSAADFKYYCQIGCSLKLCILVSHDGAKLKSCFGKCTNLCKKFLAP